MIERHEDPDTNLPPPPRMLFPLPSPPSSSRLPGLVVVEIPLSPSKFGIISSDLQFKLIRFVWGDFFIWAFQNNPLNLRSNFFRLCYNQLAVQWITATVMKQSWQLGTGRDLCWTEDSLVWNSDLRLCIWCELLRMPEIRIMIIIM